MANEKNAKSAEAKASHVRIVNHHSTTLGLPPVTQERAKQLGVTIVKEHRDRILNPGENNVSAEHWNAVKDESPVSDWMKAGLLEESDDDTSKPEGPTEVASLTELEPAKAVEYINTATDRDKLAKVGADEKRPQVLQALQRRLEALGVKQP